MSLLLDALKKAAQQKKKQAEEAEPDTELTTGDTIASSETKTEIIDGAGYLDTHIISVEDTEYVQTGVIESDPITEYHSSDDIRPTTDINIDVTLIPGFDEDKTISLLTTNDVSDFLDDAEVQTDNSGTVSEVYTEKAEEAEDDLSLNLVNQKQTNDTTSPATHTNETNVQILAGQAADTDGLELAGHQQQETEQTSTLPTDSATPEAAAGIEHEPLKNESTSLRQDTTPTYTYAPDNYDRTLVRPVDEDASKFFAGMKAEEGVLMTPDYAKRVFLSKSFASKSQFYKLYTGIGLIIVLAISMYAAFELEYEITQIDSTLAQLKRDPMPGLIKPPAAAKDSGLFDNSADPDVDNKTLDLIESALLETVTIGSDVGADSIQDVSTASEPEASTTATEEAVLTTVAASTTAIQEDSPVTKVTQPVQQAKPKSSKQPSSGSLQIVTDTRPEEKYQRLAEAYRAYQRGDDETALQKYNQVLELEPNNRNALLARAAIAIQNAEIKSAINDYRALLLANPKDSLAMSSLISLANISPQQSETQLKLMIREEPDSPYLNFALANVYGSQNRWQEAQGHYFKALEVAPDNPTYAYNLAISLEHIAKPKVAIAYYERALINYENGLATFNKDVVDRRIEMLRRL